MCVGTIPRLTVYLTVNGSSPQPHKEVNKTRKGVKRRLGWKSPVFSFGDLCLSAIKDDRVQLFSVVSFHHSVYSAFVSSHPHERNKNRREKMRFLTVGIVCTFAVFHLQIGSSYHVAGFSFVPPALFGSRTWTTAFCGENRASATTMATRQSSTKLSGSNQQPFLDDHDTEETLLKIHFSVLPGVSVARATDAVTRYCRSFPFAAVLPVQPLMYLPTDDGGVDVTFLRKKTDEKSATDGGIRFFVTATRGGDEDRDAEGGGDGGRGMEVTAKRNSNGQTIQKITSERLVVTAFVAGITGEGGNKYGAPPPLEEVRVTSLYHKWM